MGKLLVPLAIGALLALVPLPAHAQAYPACTSDPSPEEVEAAKGAFMAGKAAFDEADYERAITYWSDAYRRDCTAHDLLRNLARAYELSGQKQAAVDALETYLARVPEAESREQLTVRIEKLEEAIAEEAKQAEAKQASVTSPPAGTPPPVPPPAPPRGRKPVAPLVLAGVGGVVVVVGGVGYLAAASKTADYEEQCGADRGSCPSDQVEADADASRDRQIVFGITTWAGVGIAAGGVVWYALAPRRAPKSALRPSVAPVVAPGYGGLSFGGRF